MTSQRPDKKFPVIELFGPTIQGEGTMCGNVTHFMRLGVCDYKCVMCDSKNAVDPEQIKKNARYLTAQEMFDELYALDEQWKCPWLTLTGGNPCVHNLTDFVKHCRNYGIKIAVETQGTFLPEWLFQCQLVTISPKGPGMGETFNDSLFENFVDRLILPSIAASTVHEDYRQFPETCLKIVVFDEADFEFAKHVWSYCPQVPLYLSLGNKWIPDEGEQLGEIEHKMALLKHYENTAEKLYKDPILNKAKFLPQLHTLVWSNDKGR